MNSTTNEKGLGHFCLPRNQINTDLFMDKGRAKTLPVQEMCKDSYNPHSQSISSYCELLGPTLSHLAPMLFFLYLPSDTRDKLQQSPS